MENSYFCREPGSHNCWWTESSFMPAAAAKSLQSCPTLCDPIDSSPPGSPVPGILQARTLEWVAISFSDAWRWKMKVKSLSRVGLWATPQTAAYQAPPSMGFSRQEDWSGVPSPSPKQLSLGITKFTKLINQFTSPEMNPKEDITSEGSSFITLSIYSNLATFLVIKKHILAYVQCLKKYFFLRTEIIQITAQ